MTRDVLNIHYSKIVPNPLNKIVRGSSIDNPEAIKALAESILSQGIIQPLEVFPADEDGQHKIIVGERRWRAARLLGDKAPLIPCIINQDAGDELAQLVRMGIENLQRQDIPPITEARYFQELIIRGLDVFAIVDFTGRKIGYIRRKLQLLNLSPKMQEEIDSRRIGQNIYESVKDLPLEIQEDLASKISGKPDAYARRVASLVKSKLSRVNGTGEASTPKFNPKDETKTLRRLCMQLTAHLVESVKLNKKAAEALSYHDDLLSEDLFAFASDVEAAIKRGIASGREYEKKKLSR